MPSPATTAAGFVLSYPRAALLCELSADRALETDESRLVERDTQVDLEHGLEDGPCYPLSVKVDATRNASAYGLRPIFVALENDEDLIVSQVPALQLPVGGGMEIPSAQGRELLESSKKAISGSPCSSSTQSA